MRRTAARERISQSGCSDGSHDWVAAVAVAESSIVEKQKASPDSRR
jgi:hypothetical protein